MKGKITVRDFIPSDTEKILKHREETACISFPGLKMDKEHSRKSMLFHLKKYPGTIKVAECGGRMIGFIEFRPKSGSFGRYGYINIIFVEKNHRNRGVGAVLLREAEKWFISAGIRCIQATVTNTNGQSVDFFRKEGYLPRRVVVEKRI
jgi:ribosomal protein S18 acetylase RimI-like enzyme